MMTLWITTVFKQVDRPTLLNILHFILLLIKMSVSGQLV